MPETSLIRGRCTGLLDGWSVYFPDLLGQPGGDHLRAFDHRGQNPLLENLRLDGLGGDCGLPDLLIDLRMPVPDGLVFGLAVLGPAFPPVFRPNLVGEIRLHLAQGLGPTQPFLDVQLSLLIERDHVGVEVGRGFVPVDAAIDHVM